MASTTSGSGAAFTVLPIVGYALLAVVLAYLALRGFRYFKGVVAARMSSASLPKPVLEARHKGFGFGRSTAWDWRRWSSLVPRVPSWSKAVPEISKGKAKAVATAKNLSVELLPTTGLPPPPTSVPSTPPKSSPQLVDLNSPPTPSLTTGATSTTASFPASPRTPSPPFPVHTTSKPLFPSHPSYPRPPSPHALLATTPPPSKPHRRSRSLGGVPVRRLSSGGRSGLRNAVELREFSSTPGPNHTRGTSREHLLIDFTSSGSSDEEDDRQREEEPVFKISPAASDIGVLPLPPAGNGKEIQPVVDARMVGRHVPLVDLSDVVEVGNHKVDEDSWKWFSSRPVPSLSFSLGRRVQSFVDSSRPKQNQQPASFPLAEKLVDVDDSTLVPKLVSGPAHPASVVVHRMEVDAQVHPPLVDFGDHEMVLKETPLVDLHDDAVNTQLLGSKGAQLVDIEDHLVASLRQSQVSSLPPPPPPLPSTRPVLVKAAFSHPLEDLVTIVHTEHVLPPRAAPEPEPIVISAKEDDEPGLLFAASQPEPVAELQPEVHHEVLPSHKTVISPASAVSDTSFHYPLSTHNPAHDTVEPVEPPSPLLIPLSDSDAENTTSSVQSAVGWGWDDLGDPWGNHVPEPEPEAETKSEKLELDVSSPDSEVFVYSGKDGASIPGADEAEEMKEGDLITFEAPTSLTLHAETRSEEASEMDHDHREVSPTVEEIVEVLDKSPSGSLFATVLPDDDGGEDGEEPMPPLDLGGAFGVPEPASELKEVFSGEEASVDGEEEEEAEVTPKPTPASVKLELPLLTVDIPVVADPDVPIIVVQDSVDNPEVDLPAYPDPDLLPLPDSPLISADAEVTAQSPSKDDDRDPEEKSIASQTPTPPASPPPISPLRFVAGNKSRPPSPAALSAKLRLPPSPRLAIVVPPPPSAAVGEDNENETPTALTASSASSASSSFKLMWEVKEVGDEAVASSLLSSPGLRRVLVDMDVNAAAATDGPQEAIKEAENKADVIKEEEKERVEEREQPQEQPIHAHGLKLSSSLPGSFPDSTSTLSIRESESSSTLTSSASTTSLPSAISSPSTTIAARLALAPAVLTPRPSVRSLARSPLDIALAMQLRPGLGAGADPAWMVRFLMAMFGWLAVVVSGGEQF